MEALGYAAIRGFGPAHPTVGELDVYKRQGVTSVTRGRFSCHGELE